MKRQTFGFLKLMALGAVIATMLIQGTSANRANPARRMSENLDLSNEVRTVDAFNDDLLSFDRKRLEIGKKSTVTNDEFNGLERTGNDLKGRVSQLRDAIVTIVRKLKAAGRWDSLDEDILIGLSPGDRTFVLDNGGLRRILEGAVTDLNSQAGDEIVAPLSQLSSKLTQSKMYSVGETEQGRPRGVAAGHTSSAANPAPLAHRSARCIGATARYGVALVAHGTNGLGTPNVSVDTANRFSCYCHQNQSACASLALAGVN